MSGANYLSATQIRDAITSNTLTCEAVARDCLERIGSREADIHAFAHVDPDQILKRAIELDGLRERGPLHGVPIGIKDVIITSDMPTEMGSPIFKDYRSLEDAGCVSTLRSAGAMIFGKTVTCEFAGPAPSATVNPLDPTRTPGGSSSGSAAAIADFMLPVALGTQTGGSVVRPAAYCGIVGFKPTFGMISTHGVKPAAASLDTVGVMGRTVEDIELVFRVLTNAEPIVFDAQDEQVRVGLCRTNSWEAAEECARSTVEDAARQLKGLGMRVSEIDLPASCRDLPVTREIINDYERARALGWEWQTHRCRISPQLSRAIERGLNLPQARYLHALERVACCRADVAALFKTQDVLLTLSADGEAPAGFDDTGDHRFQSIWTQLHLPTIHLPISCGPNGLPVGIQLVGRRNGDARLFQIAQRVLTLLGNGPHVAGRDIVAPSAVR